MRQPAPPSPLSADPADPVPDRRGWWAVGLVSVVALAMIFTGKRAPKGPPLLHGAWALAAYMCIPLAGALLLDAKKRTEAWGWAIAAMLCAMVPIGLRTWAPGWKSILKAQPELVLVPAVVGIACAIFGGRRTGVKWANWGLGLGDWRWWAPKVSLLVVLACGFGVAAAAFIPEVGAFYPDYKPARESGLVLAMYIGAVGLYMTGWEFMYRGALLFGLSRTAGPVHAILFQAIPFFVMHRGGPETEMVASYIGGCLLAAFCWRSRSFWPAPLLHWSMNAGVQVGGLIF